MSGTAGKTWTSAGCRRSRPCNNLRAPSRPPTFTSSPLTVCWSRHLRLSGMTWEAVPSLVNGPWTRDLWQAVLPQLGVMAAIRNARNLDEAGITTRRWPLCSPSSPTLNRCAASGSCARMRFYAAYKAVSNVRWHALEAALQHSLSNVPALGGEHAILVDRSGSMFGRSPTARKTWAGAAALFVRTGTARREGDVGRVRDQLERDHRPQGRVGAAADVAVHQFGWHVHGHGGEAPEAGAHGVVILTDEQNYGGYYHTQHPR